MLKSGFCKPSQPSQVSSNVGANGCVSVMKQENHDSEEASLGYSTIFLGSEYNNSDLGSSQLDFATKSDIFVEIAETDLNLQKCHSHHPKPSKQEVEDSFVVIQSMPPAAQPSNPYLQDAKPQAESNFQPFQSITASALMASWYVASPDWQAKSSSKDGSMIFLDVDEKQILNHFIKVVDFRNTDVKQQEVLLGVVAQQKLPKHFRWLHWVCAVGGLIRLKDFLAQRSPHFQNKIPDSHNWSLIQESLKRNLTDRGIPPTELVSCVKMLKFIVQSMHSSIALRRFDESFLADLFCLVRFEVRESLVCMAAKRDSSPELAKLWMKITLAAALDPENEENLRYHLEWSSTAVIISQLLSLEHLTSELVEVLGSSRGFLPEVDTMAINSGLKHQINRDSFKKRYKSWVANLWSPGSSWTNKMPAFLDLIMVIGSKSTVLLFRLQLVAYLQRFYEFPPDLKIEDVLKPENRSLMGQDDLLNVFLWGVKDQIIKNYFQVNLK